MSTTMKASTTVRIRSVGPTTHTDCTEHELEEEFDDEPMDCVPVQVSLLETGMFIIAILSIWLLYNILRLRT
jgi:hypothetical protein